MLAQNRFAQETALFDALLPQLLVTNPRKWFVAWDGELRAIVDTLDDACRILDQQPEDVEVMVREISTEQLHLPLQFASAK